MPLNSWTSTRGAAPSVPTLGVGILRMRDVARPVMPALRQSMSPLSAGAGGGGRRRRRLQGLGLPGQDLELGAVEPGGAATFPPAARPACWQAVRSGLVGPGRA